MRHRLTWLVAILFGLLALRLSVDVGSPRPSIVEPVLAVSPVLGAVKPRIVQAIASQGNSASRGSKYTVASDLSGNEREIPHWPVRESNADEAAVDLFSPAPAKMHSAKPALPPSPPAAPPIVPAATEPPKTPRLPYTVVGDWTEEGRTAVFLAGGAGTKIVHVGDLIDGAFRVDHLEPGRMSVLYLPMNQTQELTWIARR